MDLFNILREDIQEIKKDVKELRNDLNDLKSFKFKLLGAAIAVSVLWSLVINILAIIFK